MAMNYAVVGGMCHSALLYEHRFVPLESFRRVLLIRTSQLFDIGYILKICLLRFYVASGQ